MSELREELLGGGINKKRVLGVILVAALLISAFAFSTFFISFLFGTQRLPPNKEKGDTEWEDVLLIAPPYPFDEDFWQDLFDQIDPDDIPELLDMLSEMFDGDIDDLDLRNFSQGLIDLLFSGAGEMEVFRVYNYLNFANMSDVLWKYESFDRYTGDGWQSTAGSDIYNFFTYGEYYSEYSPDPELLKLKMPISPNIGINSMVLPSLFPTPNIMENSISAPNLIAESETLYKTDFNSTTLDLSFTSDVDVNMTYEMFGFHLPSASEINNSAVEASWTPVPIQAKYLQLPPDINVYKSNNPYFTNHTIILNATISDTDNAFEVADKIRIYLQTQFSFPLDPDDYNPAPEGRDVVDWFCETQQGIWSDFASTFCAFTRAFGISSRYIDGFNSLMIEEFFDDDEGQLGFAIKYKNLYSWAEIYVPTDISGNGKWVQMDVFDSFAGGGIPLLGGKYNITVSTDRSWVNRPDVINITANMTSGVGDSVDNNRLTFTDLTSGQEIGTNYTDSLGVASVLYSINNSHSVGPHIIEARYDFFTAGYNLTTILGDISITLTDVNPGEINVSDAQLDITNIIGYVEDPLNSKGVEGPELNIILLEKGTSNEVLPAFSPSAINAATNGDFNDLLDLLHNTAGNYEVRADLNETWWIDTPFGDYSYFQLSVIFQVPYNPFTNSSNRMDFNITKALDIWFSVDGLPSNYPNTPPNYSLISRSQTLNLTAKIISIVHGPMPNRQVYFYDFSRGDVMIGSDISDSNGIASINYLIGDYCRSGPNLLYARIGLQKNYSYFVLNEKPTINIISGPSPQVINRTGGGDTQFNIIGEIFDSTNTSLPISFSQITLKLLKGGGDYSSNLTPSEFFQTDSNGYFDLNFGVASNMPPGNYSLRLDFNGSVNFGLPYPFTFNLPFINTSTYFGNDLKIDAESSLEFWINGFPSDDAYNPIINRDGILNLTVYIHQGGVPVADGEWVNFLDGTQDNLFIGADQTTAGYAQVFYNTNWNTTAGPHLIYATWNNKFNFSYFILDAPISVNLDICPQPGEINRSGAIGRNFWIHGYLNDTSNGNPIKFSIIEVRLNDSVDVSFYLNEPRFTNLGGTGEIDLIYSVSASTPAKNYTLQVRFDGIFNYLTPFYPQFFNLNFLGNMTDSANGFFDLKVIDPLNITIFFFIDGFPTLSFYSNFTPPETYNGGEQINFSVYITQGGSPVIVGDVSFTDVYTGNPLGTQLVTSGYASILADSTSWHAGLHRIRTQWSGSSTTNTTYVIINKTVSIFRSIDKTSIIRNLDTFSVSGTVQEGVDLLRGLRVNLILLDSSFNDVSGFLVPPPPQTDTTNIFGYFQFDNSINLNCPQGQYYIRIDFNGTIDAPGIFMNDYMLHSNSSLIPINITAGTSLIPDTYWSDWESFAPDSWILGDTVHINGTLRWDNLTAMEGINVIISVRWASNGTWIASNFTVFTGLGGTFEGTLIVGSNWPDLRAETNIWVSYIPSASEYIEGDEEQYP